MARINTNIYKHRTVLIRTIYVYSWLVILSLTIISSCASVSPVSMNREQPLSFKSIEYVEPVWQVFADGVDYFHGKTSSPRLEFWALRINLAEPDLRIVVRAGAATDEQLTTNKNISFSTRVSSFVRDNNLIAGINTTPFDIITSREGRPIQNKGIVISDGKKLAPINPHFDALVFYADGSADIVRQSEITSTENIKNAVGGFHQILANGQVTPRALGREARHPRSAVGISSENGKHLYLLVIDGRRSGSAGATEYETALLLRALGSYDGLNLDGGGSTALALRYGDGSIRTANTPIHGGIPGRERAVAACLGIQIGHGNSNSKFE